MGKASSSKKVARVAKAGGRAGRRTTRALGYPLSVTALIVIGFALVAFVKVNRKAADNTPPRQTVTDANGQVTKTGDHFHEAIGFYVCGQWAPNLTDAAAAASTNGIHTLGDGIISIAPTTPEAAGKNAKLGLFLGDVGVTLTNDTLTFPRGVSVPGAKAGGSTDAGATTTTVPGAGATSTTAAPGAPTTTAPTTTAAGAPTTSAAPGDTTTTAPAAPPASFSTSGQCNGKPAVLRVAQWNESFGDDGRTPTTQEPSKVYKKNFAAIRLDRDRASLTVYYGPADEKIPLPQATPNLLHLQDLAPSTPTSTPSVPGVPNGIPNASTPGSSPETPSAPTPGGSTPTPGGSTPASSTPAGSAPASSAPATSAP